jgi:hypothetical protein
MAQIYCFNFLFDLQYRNLVSGRARIKRDNFELLIVQAITIIPGKTILNLCQFDIFKNIYIVALSAIWFAWRAYLHPCCCLFAFIESDSPISVCFSSQLAIFVDEHRSLASGLGPSLPLHQNLEP